MSTLKALSIKQPYASLILSGNVGSGRGNGDHFNALKELVA